MAMLINPDSPDGVIADQGTGCDNGQTSGNLFSFGYPINCGSYAYPYLLQPHINSQIAIKYYANGEPLSTVPMLNAELNPNLPPGYPYVENCFNQETDPNACPPIPANPDPDIGFKLQNNTAGSVATYIQNNWSGVALQQQVNTGLHYYWQQNLPDSAWVFIQAINTPFAYKIVAATAINRHLAEQAATAIAQMNTPDTLLFNLLYQVINSGRELNDLNSQELSQLQQIATTYTDRPLGSIAESALTLAIDTTYLRIPETLPALSEKQPYNQQIQPTNIVNVAPNPASNFTLLTVCRFLMY